MQIKIKLYGNAVKILRKKIHVLSLKKLEFFNKLQILKNIFQTSSKFISLN